MKRTIIATRTSQNMYLVEFGSSYSSDPWDVLCVCETNELAEEYISNQLEDKPTVSSLYHITEVPVYRGK
jgi:hypothetical protein